MKKVDFTEPRSAAWRRWKARCQDAREADIATVEGGGTLEDSDLYKAQKGWFKNPDGPFRGKCAYCEQTVSGNHPGDIEHYRPKSGVRNLDWSHVSRVVGDVEQGHPGYYWLRQELSNLLFSCSDCNRPNRFKDIRFGKECRFPVDGPHAWAPGEEEQEHAQLINPCIQNPDDHLEFNPKNGLFSGKTSEGGITIELLGLNLRNLDRERKSVYEDTLAKFSFALRDLVTNLPLTQSRIAALEDEDWRPFASIREKAIDDGRAKCGIIGGN